MTREQADALLQKFAASIHEHFPHVIILCSTEDKEGTDLFVARRGNYYAQQAMMQEVIVAKDQETRDDETKKQRKGEDDASISP